MSLRIPDAVLLDDDVRKLAETWTWKVGRDGYPQRRANGARIYLHHLVLGPPRWPLFVVDHVNRNKLDNRRVNLRWVRPSENKQNVDAQARNLTGIRGVSWDRANGRFKASVRIGTKLITLGYFSTAEEAGAAASAKRREVMPMSFEVGMGGSISGAQGVETASAPITHRDGK